MALRFDRHSLDPKQSDLSTWPDVATNNLTGEKRRRFDKLRRVLEDYFDQKKVKDICAEHQISRVEINRVLKRCLAIHSDGRIWGFRALISHMHQKTYQRTTPIKGSGGKRKAGNAGAMTQLFEMFPTLLELVETLFLKKHKDTIVHESRIPLKSIHKRFIKACRDLGLTAKDYPLSQQYQGRVALWHFLGKLENTRMKEVAAARYGNDAARKLRNGDREPSSEPRRLRPIEVVEFDGHRIDGHCTVHIPSPHGGFVSKVIDRFWILTIIEVLTRTILGYYITLNREYNQDDVLSCVKNALTPWQPKTLTIPGLAYPPHSGLPSFIYPDLEWAVWDEFKYDNAKAHLADKTLDRLCSTVGCATNPGPVKSPDNRSILERWHQTFEENGFHRLPSTTGSGPKDPRRRNSEKAALKFDIYLGEIEELASVIIADYNCTPHSGIGGRSPLEYLGFLLEDADVKDSIRKLPRVKRNNLRLLNYQATREVRGSKKEGKRPYIEFAGARYQNSVLGRNPELIGKRLTLSVDPEDPRSLIAFLPSGAELGILTARGIWGREPHTLKMRSAIGQLRHKKLIHYTQNDDPIHIYLDYLAKKAQTSKGAARQYAATQRAIQKTQSLAPKRPKSPPKGKTDKPVSPLTQNEPPQQRKGFTF